MTQEIDNLMTKRHEVVHTYGWYLRRYVADARAKGAIPVIASHVPRNIRENAELGLEIRGVASTQRRPIWSSRNSATSGHRIAR